MNTLSNSKVTVAALAIALLGVACGKDKPAEPAEAEPAAVAEEPAAPDEPSATAPSDEPSEPSEANKDKVVKEGEEPAAEPGADPKTAPDDPKARLRQARERGERPERPERPGRRPRPLRDGAGDERPGRPGPGQPNALTGAEPGAPEPATPDPGAPDPAMGAEAPPVVAEAPTPTPVEPGAPIPTPIEPGAPADPAQPAYEIRNDAAALDAGKMLPLTTVTEVLGKQLAPGVPLQGIALAAGYGSILYATADAKGAGKGAETFGVALQAWRDPTRREAEDRFRRMRLQYPNADDVSALSPLKGFYSYFGTIQTLTWVDPAKRMVLSLSCGEGLCSHDAMTRLAKSARERM
ncbi:MAG: hypothetical protein IT385_03490 [Deltaproteobacteria bacterium]|nr:hypothetical protein [Deltaproteobacteria bacterium]